MNDWFLESVEREVRQNVRRVKKHPSNIQWAGGNEIEPVLLFFNASTVPISFGSLVVGPGPLDPRYLNNVSSSLHSRLAQVDMGVMAAVRATLPGFPARHRHAGAVICASGALYSWTSTDGVSTGCLHPLLNDEWCNQLGSVYSATEQCDRWTYLRQYWYATNSSLSRIPAQIWNPRRAVQLRQHSVV